jgi:hypothetical protein
MTPSSPQSCTLVYSPWVSGWAVASWGAIGELVRLEYLGNQLGYHQEESRPGNRLVNLEDNVLHMVTECKATAASYPQSFENRDTGLIHEELFALEFHSTAVFGPVTAR